MEWGERIGRRIKLRDLHVLLAVVQCGSMSKAARQLSVSNPVVTKAVADLEHTLGVRLLERNPHGIKLTQFGRAILDRSHAAFDELRQGVKDIEFLADPTAGEVRIGGTAPHIAFVSTVIDRLHRRHPRMVIQVTSTAAESLLRDLDERNLDLLILRKFGPFEDRLNFEVLYDNPNFVVAGASNRWTRRRCIELSELMNELWVLPPADTRFGTIVRDIFASKSLPFPRAAVVALGLELTNHLLRTGRYLAIHPESLLTFPAPHPFVRKLAVELPSVSGPVGILTLKRRELSPAARLFIACAREVVRPLGRRK